MELAVKNIINNREVNNQEAMQNPESLLNFKILFLVVKVSEGVN